jgi:hypothetical protein
MGKLNLRLKGTTLIETIVSMMLIVLIMTIIIQSLFQVTKEIGSNIKPYAYFWVKQCLNNNKEDIEYSKLKDNNNPVIISKILTKYENYDDLFVLEVKATNIEGKLIYSAKRIISDYDIKKVTDK